MNIIVSACLLGAACRYDGKSAPKENIINLMGKYTLIPICPEIYGGLPTPRLPSEKMGHHVIMKDGTNVTEQYKKGAQQALYIAKMYNCKYAVLKERSPSCGKGKIYDGTFTEKLVHGDGVTAELFNENGIKVFGESDVDQLIKELKNYD